MVTEDEINKLVIARISSMPENMKISIGNYGTFDKYQLIENVKKRCEIGKKVVEIQLFYLRSMKGMLKWAKCFIGYDDAFIFASDKNCSAGRELADKLALPFLDSSNQVVLFNPNLYSVNMKCLVTNEAIRAYMHVADQIIELGIDAILAGGFNVTGLEGVVQTMFIPIWGITFTPLTKSI